DAQALSATSSPGPAIRTRQSCARTNDKGERIKGEVVLPRQKGPKGKERGKEEAGRDENKTPARRHYGLGRRGDHPTRPESDEWESDSKDNHPPRGMVAQTGHDVVIENPIAELRPNAIKRKRGHDRSRNNQRAGEERCQRAENLPPTDTQSLAANENQSHRTPDQSRHDEEQCLHGDAKAKTHEEARDQRAPHCQCATE